MSSESAAPTTPTTVTTRAGAVSGRVADGIHAFLGVPYAAPPFGARRFAAPEPVEPWDGVRPATEFGATAPKPAYSAPYDALLPEPVIPGEDCLNLNVWTPDPSAAGLPVFVWIHGGAFVNGSGAVPVYDGSAFARDGVVCVTVNYRLGVDGFLHFADDGPANRGLLDQVAALRWVQDNIAAFGGDPSRVTVGGESAGAMSVGALLSMPAARGLFRRAVLQSGAGHHALSAPTATRIGGYVAERLGVPATREGLAAVPLADLVAAQQAVTAEAVTNPDPARWGEVLLDMMPFEPVVDGVVLPDLPIRTLAAGGPDDVEVLVGTNRDEQRLFLVPNGLFDLVDDNLLGLALFGYAGGDASAVHRLRQTYDRAHPGATPGELLAEIATDWFYRVPAVRLAEARVRAGAPVWVFEFGWPSPRYDARLGACHALELPFVFDTVRHEANQPLVGSPAPAALAEQTHAAWVRFITEGDPGWARYDLAHRTVQEFNDVLRAVEDPRADERRAWDGLR